MRSAPLACWFLGCTPVVGERLAQPPTPTSAEVERPSELPVDAPDPARASVVLRAVPPALAIDGDLSEWGSLVAEPGPRSRPPAVSVETEPGPREETGGPSSTSLPDAENPADAPSRVAIAIGPGGLTLAAELGEGRGDELWIGVADRPPAPLPLGVYQRGGYTREMKCERQEVDTGEGGIIQGELNPPELVAACEALKTRYAAFVVAHARRFVRRFSVTPRGVFELGADGSSIQIQGATLSTRKSASGHTTLEASLPLSAMPRLTQAPLTRLRVAASTANTIPADIAANPWLFADLPAPVGFAPHAELRRRVFAFDAQRLYPAGESYHPAAPLRVETLEYAGVDARDRSVVGSKEHVLFEPRVRFGDVEIGVARAAVTAITVHRGGELLHVLRDREDSGHTNDDTGNRTFLGAVARDGEIHLLSFLPRQDSPWLGTIHPHFALRRLAMDGRLLPPQLPPIAPDLHESLLAEETESRAPGALRRLVPAFDAALEPLLGEAAVPWIRGDTTLHVDRGLASFGFSADYVLSFADPDRHRWTGLRTTFRWDARVRAYVSDVRLVAPAGPDPFAEP